MTILEKAIKDSGYKKIFIAKKINISDRTLLNWERYENIDQILKFHNLCKLLNINLSEIAEEIEKEHFKKSKK